MPFIREKPHRLPREFHRGFVTASFTACVDTFRRPFEHGNIVTEFVGLLNTAAIKHECVIPIYCFMPDHFHVIFEGRSNESDLWQAMTSFKQSSGYWFGQNLRQFTWQKDFHDRVIRNFVGPAVRIRYIADNPVRGGLVKRWDEYPFTGSIGIELKSVMADTATE